VVEQQIKVILFPVAYKIALFDADIGLANLDVMLNVTKTAGKKNILHLLKGEADLKDIVININENLILIPGDSGDGIFKYGDSFILDRFYDQLKELDYLDYVIIDTGAGIGESVQSFIDASDYAIVVTTSEPAAITDAYAMLKIILEKRDGVFMVLNQVRSKKDGEALFEKIKQIAQKKQTRITLINTKIKYYGTASL
jgi:flagellar biosynthesis protein FlhG